MTRRVLSQVLLAGTLLVSPATAHEEGSPPNDGSVTNALCPVTVDEPVDPSIYVQYEGSRIYFCCQRCRKQFLEDPQAYVQNVSVTSVSEGDHAHSIADAEIGTVARLVRFVGRFHPVIVHFPIALLISAILSETLAAATMAHRFRDAARVLVLLGAPAATLAAAMGWAAARTASYPELARVLMIHRWLGTSTAIAAVVTLVASERYSRHSTVRRRMPYVIALSVTALLVGITGHFGGTLIFGTEHFTW